jgi:membrane associated rhomboid family serine protease
MDRRPYNPSSDVYDMQRDAEGTYAWQDLRPRNRPTLTRILIASLVVTFVAQTLIPGFTEQYALISSAVLAGQWWRLFTGPFLHANILHLAANSYFGWMIGARIEQHVGAARLLVITVVSLIGSSVLIVVGGSNAVGFSGVLFGWLASWLGFHLTPRFPGLRLSGAQRRSYLQLLAVNLVISLLPGISALGHLGGFVSGFLVSLLLGLGHPHAPRVAHA